MRHEARSIGAAAAVGVAASAFGHGPMPGSMMPDADGALGSTELRPRR
jgi:hypothetical protein